MVDIVKSNSIEFGTLIGLIAIVAALFVGFSADSQIFGYSMINIFYFFMAVAIVITFVWYLLRNKSKISIRNIKKEFHDYIRALKNVRKLPDSCRNTVLTNYISLILIFLGLILIIIAHLLNGTMNENWVGLLTVIILCTGILIFFYSWVIMAIKMKKMRINRFYKFIIIGSGGFS
ncbi:MAG: hypothetical protein NKF70_12970 [Methanobacterium sp. ERen5]|nr:MAG: hypothetical protein NKF70_12970 [Methanobacterium sp. ERen5]